MPTLNELRPHAHPPCLHRKALCSLFAQFGLPETVVTDDNTGYGSAKFEDFLKKNVITNTTSALVFKWPR